MSKARVIDFPALPRKVGRKRIKPLPGQPLAVVLALPVKKPVARAQVSMDPEYHANVFDSLQMLWDKSRAEYSTGGFGVVRRSNGSLYCVAFGECNENAALLVAMAERAYRVAVTNQRQQGGRHA